MDCVIFISLSAPPPPPLAPAVARYNFFYVMGFVDAAAAGATPKQIKGHKGTARVVIAHDGPVWEMVLAAGVSASFTCKEAGWTEDEWELFVSECVEGRIMRVQTECVVPCDHITGAACIERLIKKDIGHQKKAAYLAGLVLFDVEVDPNLLNCYRAASGGRMHHLDTRPWRMSHKAQLQMQRENHSAKERAAQLTLTGIEVGERIRRGYEVVEYARFFASAAVGDDELRQQRTDVIHQTEMELHELEAQEMDLLSEAETLHQQVEQLSAVLQFQSVLEKQMMRSEEEEAAAAATTAGGHKKKRRIITALVSTVPESL